MSAGTAGPTCDSAGLSAGHSQAASMSLEMCLRADGSFPGRVLRFPCGQDGRVDLDALDDARRQDYLFARILERLGAARSRIIVEPPLRAQVVGTTALT